jgi:DNA-binding transcriptional LysR family regulator
MMFPQSLLRQILYSFESHYPNVELHLYSEAMAETTDLVLRGECDLGISLLMNGLLPELNASVITNTEMIPVVAAGHALAAYDGMIPHSVLQGFTQIVLSNRRRQRSDIDHGVASSRTWRVVDLRTKKDLIVDGFGFGSLPRHLVAAELESGRLQPIQSPPWNRKTFRLPLHLISSTERTLGPAATWLCSQIETICEESGSHVR